MFDYKTKPVHVQAFQWRLGCDPWSAPLWFSGALDMTDNRLHGKIHQVASRLQVSTDAGTVMADDGDWIVYYASTTKRLEVVKPEDFERRFDQDERRARLRGWNSQARTG